MQFIIKNIGNCDETYEWKMEKVGGDAVLTGLPAFGFIPLAPQEEQQILVFITIDPSSPSLPPNNTALLQVTGRSTSDGTCGPQQVLTCFKVATVTAVAPDLDVNSDNTNGVSDYAPYRDAIEESIEDDPNLPGKYISVNDDDDDEDNILDSADGQNLDGLPATDDDLNIKEDDFVAMKFELPAPLDVSVATVKITKTQGNGSFRIWTRSGTSPRVASEVPAGHQLLLNGTYAAELLGVTNQDRVADLWLEGMGVSSGNNERLLFEVDPDGAGPLGFMECADAVRLRIVSLRFIGDSGPPISTVGTSARLLVSKTITDRLTDMDRAGSFPRAEVTYDGPPTGDLDNFRVELIGAPAGLTPIIAVEVLRPNNAVRNTFGYQTVSGGTPVSYRTTEQIRLVTNAADDAVGEELGANREPTRVVRLDEIFNGSEQNDRVQAKVVFGAMPCKTKLPVCRRPTEAHSAAIRTCEMHFVTLAGVMANIGTIVSWMNDDWAQAAMRFRSVNPVAGQVTVSNALVVRGNAGGNGNLTVTINGNAFTIPVANGQTTNQIANAVAAAINGVGGLTAEAFPMPPPALVIINRGTVVQPTFNNPQSSVPNVTLSRPLLTYDDALSTTLEIAVLGLNYKDGNPSTIDFFAVASASVYQNGLHAATGGDAAVPDLPGWDNTIVATVVALPPTAAANTHVPGHEVAHCLFNVGTEAHSLVSTNLFYGAAGVEPDVYGTKRLTETQNGDARAQSGPGSPGPLLLQQN